MLKRLAILFFAVSFATSAFAADKEPLRSMTLGKYPQRMTTKFTTVEGLPSNNVSAVAVCGDRAVIGTAAGIAVRDGAKWQVFNTNNGLVSDNVTALACDGERIIVGSSGGLQSVDRAGNGGKKQLFTHPVTALVKWGSGWLAGTPKGIFTVGGATAKVEKFGDRGVTALAVGKDGAAWIGTKEGLFRYDGKTLQAFNKTPGKPGLLNDEVRALYADADGYLWVGTPVGLSRRDPNGEWDVVTGKQGGLPYEDVTSITGRGDELWVGTTIGVSHWTGEEWRYFSGKRYIPGDAVHGVALDASGAAWVATAGGIAKLEYKNMTLEEKAAYFEKRIRERHNRYGQVADSRLTTPGDLSTSVPFSADNDGLWSSVYIAAECFRYAATGDPEAKRLARESLDALLRLESITGIPGFMARSFALADEYVGEGGEWDHFTPDGKWKWKGDTSSDEVVGHYFGHSVYYDLCADENEKKEIRAVVKRITDYIIRNGYYLLDTDGKPTYWGKWAPEFFRGPGYFQRGLNSLEILSHLLTAYHITGDEKYRKEYLWLGFDKRYLKYAVKQKLNMPGIINHSDDELAFFSYYPALLYDKDPRSRRYLVESFQRSWNIERSERNPMWNIIYGALMPGEFDLEYAVDTISRLPMDTIDWSVRNSHRSDIAFSRSSGRFGEIESVRPLPADERKVMRWNENVFALDGGGNGTSEDDGAAYLLPYWMARYYGFVKEGK